MFNGHKTHTAFWPKKEKEPASEIEKERERGRMKKGSYARS